MLNWAAVWRTGAFGLLLLAQCYLFLLVTLWGCILLSCILKEHPRNQGPSSKAASSEGHISSNHLRDIMSCHSYKGAHLDCDREKFCIPENCPLVAVPRVPSRGKQRTTYCSIR